MSPCQTDRNQDYVLGALGADEVERLEKHLHICARCAREVEEFRILFTSLRDLPLPVVPKGIADAVIARLAPLPIWARLVRCLRTWVQQPASAALAGIASGLLLALLREPLALYFGRLTGGIVARASTDIVRAITGLLRGLLDFTAVLGVLASLLAKADPILRAMGEALKAVLGPDALVPILLSLATVLFLGRLVGLIQREELSHAKE